MIIVEGLHKHFGTVIAVDNVDLRVATGEVVVVVGPSGSGKSTVLRCLNLLETPTAGHIWVDGNEVTARGCDLNAVREEIGMVFQQFNLCPHLTALDNIVLAQRLVRRRSRAESERIAQEQLERVGIPEKLTRIRDNFPVANNSVSLSRDL